MIIRGRFFAMLALASIAGWSFAQAPAKTEPLPTPPPPPPDVTASDVELEPQVTIIRRDNDVVEEVRTNGQLRYVRVTPRTGKPYYLLPDQNGNTYIRRDSLDPTLKVPMWVLFSF